EVLAGDAVLAVGLGVEVAELLLEDAVDAAGLLLLPELEHVLRLPDAPPPVLPRRVGPPLDRALHGVALWALEEQLHALPPALPAHRPRVSPHQTRLRLGGRQ